MLSRIIGPNHYVLIQNQDDITGNYNGLTEDKILIVCDECFFIGDKKGANIIKNEITSHVTRIREMYKDPRHKENHKRFIFISNDKGGFVPAGDKSRRYFVLDCDINWILKYFNSKAKETNPLASNVTAADYFNNLFKPTDVDFSDVVKTWANFLYNLPISTYDPRNFPLTQILFNQKINSMSPMNRWWMDLLQSAKIFGEPDTDGNVSVICCLEEKTVTQLTIPVLYYCFKKYVGTLGTSYKTYLSVSEGTFTQTFKNLVPSMSAFRTVPTTKMCRGTPIVVAEIQVTLPPLKELRDYFSKEVVPGSEFHWNVSFDARTDDTSKPEVDQKNRMPHTLEGPTQEVVFNDDLINSPYPEDFFGVNLKKLMATCNLVDDDGIVIETTCAFSVKADRQGLFDRSGSLSLENQVDDECAHVEDIFASMRRKSASTVTRKGLRQLREREELEEPLNAPHKKKKKTQ